MPRMRMLKPGFFSNENLAELPPLVRLLFAGLWTIADRAGRLEDRPKRIKAALIPWDDLDVDKALDALANSPERFVIRYVANGRKYLQISNFAAHQHPHVNEPKSEIPPPSASYSLVVASPAPTLDSAEHQPSTGQAPTLISPTRAESESCNGVGVFGGVGVEDGSEAKASREVAFATPDAPRQEPGANPETAPLRPLAWESYSTAYEAKYRVKPVRNAKVNSQFAQLVKRLGAEDAPRVAAWYLSHAGALYVRSGHCVDLLLRDAEKLRTEWATGHRITETRARQEDRTATNVEGWSELLRGNGHVD
jgi:hypothetical protein